MFSISVGVRNLANDDLISPPLAQVIQQSPFAPSVFAYSTVASSSFLENLSAKPLALIALTLPLIGPISILSASAKTLNSEFANKSEQFTIFKPNLVSGLSEP